MIKTLLAQVKEYKKASLLAPMFAVLEVFMEVLIPLVMAEIIDNGIGKNNTGYAIRMGLLMLGLAMLSLAFGVWLSGADARCSLKARNFQDILTDFTAYLLQQVCVKRQNVR